MEMQRKGDPPNGEEDGSEDSDTAPLMNKKKQNKSTIFCKRNKLLCYIFQVAGLLLVALLLAAVIAPIVHTIKVQKLQPWTNVRLQRNILPQEYDINLEPNLDTFVVLGSVNISCEVVSGTGTWHIILHIRDMDIQQPNVTQHGKQLQINEHFSYPTNEFYVLTLSDPLQVGSANILLQFSYNLSDELHGFYRSSYLNSSSEKRYLATSHMEPNHARMAFPCFDEPSFKANFTIHVTHDPRYWAASNMPPVSTTQAQTVAGSRERQSGSGLVTTHFQTTPKMSTYVVAFIVSDFLCINGSVDNGRVELRVCCNPTTINYTDHAMETTKRALQFYEDYFNIPFPLPKIDLFAIPDFSAGGEENWGLITFREHAIIYNNLTDSEKAKMKLFTYITHEVAHMWFGDLVTMAWWDGLWLKEGFATFLSSFAIDNLEPQWDMLGYFYVSQSESTTEALLYDALNESHPIVATVTRPEDANSIFDRISYGKGASLIYMLQNYLGKNVFRHGLSWYQTEHSYGNTETHQLWEALQQGADDESLSANSNGSTVRDIMDTWTKQMGFPLVTVKSDGVLTQTRFFAVTPEDQSSIPQSPYNYTWKIPFNFITEMKPSDVQQILMTEDSVHIPWPENEGWIKANVNQTGFYRVNYDLQNWRALTQHLFQNPNSSFLLPVDRAGLLNDAFALSSAGFLDTITALNLSRYLVNERNYIPWKGVLKWLKCFRDRLVNSSLLDNFQRLVSNHLLQPVVDDLGFNRTNLSHLQTLLRSQLFNLARQYGNQDVIQGALTIFNAWKNSGRMVDPNLKKVVYSVGVAYGNEEDWEFVWGYLKANEDPNERELLRYALAQAREPSTLNRYLNYTITRLRTQDTLHAIRDVSENEYGRDLAWNFLRNNWDYLFEHYGKSISFSKFLRTLIQSFTTEQDLKEVKDFFHQYPNRGAGDRGYHQGVEHIRENIAWLQTNQDLLQSCLNNIEDCFRSSVTS